MIGAQTEEQIFLSPSYGKYAFSEMLSRIATELREYPGAAFFVSVGTDSEELQGLVKLVSAVVVWRVGHGAHAYRTETTSMLPEKMAKQARMRERILQEILLTGTLAQELRSALRKMVGDEALPDVEVHADVGPNGGTSVMMREVIGMLRGYGFSEDEIKVKPEAYAASSVADHYI